MSVEETHTSTTHTAIESSPDSERIKVSGHEYVDMLSTLAKVSSVDEYAQAIDDFPHEEFAQKMRVILERHGQEAQKVLYDWEEDTVGDLIKNNLSSSSFYKSERTLKQKTEIREQFDEHSEIIESIPGVYTILLSEELMDKFREPGVAGSHTTVTSGRNTLHLMFVRQSADSKLHVTAHELSHIFNDEFSSPASGDFSEFPDTQENNVKNAFTVHKDEFVAYIVSAVILEENIYTIKKPPEHFLYKHTQNAEINGLLATYHEEVCHVLGFSAEGEENSSEQLLDFIPAIWDAKDYEELMSNVLKVKQQRQIIQSSSETKREHPDQAGRRADVIKKNRSE